jgi:hypothetical protein
MTKILTQLNRSRVVFDRFLLAAVLGLFSIPILIDVWISGWQRSFLYLAADTFYYTTIARNFANIGFPSFDGVIATNGFNPAWLIVLSGMYKILDFLGTSEPVIITFVLALSVGLIGSAIVLIWILIRRDIGYVPKGFLLIPVGVLAPAVAWTRPQYDNLWSFANGMETPLLLLTWAALLLAIQSQSTRMRNHAILGALLGFAILARLDMVFFVPALMFANVWRDRFSGVSPWDSIKSRYVVYLIPLFVVLAYVVINFAYSGAYLPISASMKSTFPFPDAADLDSRRFIKSFVYPSFKMHPALWYRYIQMFLPAVIALAFAVWQMRQGRAGSAKRVFTLAMFSTSLYVIFLASYNYLFVPIWYEGHWYYSVSSIFASLAVLYWWSNTDLWRRIP